MKTAFQNSFITVFKQQTIKNKDQIPPSFSYPTATEFLKISILPGKQDSTNPGYNWSSLMITYSDAGKGVP